MLVLPIVRILWARETVQGCAPVATGGKFGDGRHCGSQKAQNEANSNFGVTGTISSS